MYMYIYMNKGSMYVFLISYYLFVPAIPVIISC